MDVVKLPKKVRMVCYEIMDGKEGALDTLDSFADKYPHQVAAVKAEVAYFNLDYEKALALDLTILPWLEEWYYSNVSDEHMIAMTVAAIQLHQEQELIDQAKALLMERNGMTEAEAHRYIQKCSMDSGTNLVETAQMVISLIHV